MKMSAKLTVLQTYESPGCSCVLNHEDFDASGWSVVNGFMFATSPNDGLVRRANDVNRERQN